MNNKFSFDTGFCGWMTIKVGKYPVKASYLRSTPMELVEAAESLLSSNFATLKIDAEGTDYLVLFTDKEVKVYDFIIGRDGFSDSASLAKIKIRYYEVANIIYNTVNDNIDSFIRNFYVPIDKEHEEEIRENLTEKLRFLKEAIDFCFQFRNKEKFSLYYNYHNYRGWFYKKFIIIYHLIYERLFAREN